MDSFSKAIHTLEFDKIREMLAAVCPTDGAAALARALRPEKDGEKALLLQRETADALKTASMRGSPSFGGIADPSESLRRAGKGRVPHPRRASCRRRRSRDRKGAARLPPRPGGRRRQRGGGILLS